MPAQSTEAIAMLKDDHRKVRDLFQHYDAARDPSAKRERAQEVIAELEIHAQLEEQLFYPAVADQSDEGEELAQESMLEHQQVKTLMQELWELGLGCLKVTSRAQFSCPGFGPREPLTPQYRGQLIGFSA